MNKLKKNKKKYAIQYKPDSFDPENHYYPKSINAGINSVVSNFFHLGNQRIVNRYCHLNPFVKKDKLKQLLSYEPKHFRWSGGDLFNVVSQSGKRKMVLIETNSCPSGQKSMPLLHEDKEQGGYRKLIEFTFKPVHDQLQKQGKILSKKDGKLAVVYDKNEMESSGYAAVMADVFQENVYLVEFKNNDKDPPVRFTNLNNSKDHSKDNFKVKDKVKDKVEDNSKDEKKKLKNLVMEVLDKKSGKWVKIRACFRYLTQKPWNRLPVNSIKTFIMNPIIACLSGGRNKLLASKAYDMLNATIINSGIELNTPKTIQDVNKSLVPLWVNTMGGYAVIKNPYSNAGQGVWTITSPEELKKFMLQKSDYEQYIVQSLIGNYKWSSVIHSNQFYHVGTVPDKSKRIYVADLRMMIHYSYGKKGFSPLSMYARRARAPLENNAPKKSWDVLGTNLSYKKEDGSWDTSTKRLIVCAQGSFNKLGLGVDDLINSYIQTVLATVAIDKLCCQLVKDDGSFNLKLFSALNKDPALLKELLDFKF